MKMIRHVACSPSCCIKGLPRVRLYSDTTFCTGVGTNAFPSACLQPMTFIPPTDDAGIASGLVIREMHAALLRGIDARGGLGAVGAEAPRAAKLALSEAQAAADWTRRVSKAILDSPPYAVDDDARVSSWPLQCYVHGAVYICTSQELHGFCPAIDTTRVAAATQLTAHFW